MPIQMEHYVAATKKSPFYDADSTRLGEASGPAVRLQHIDLPAGWLVHCFGGWESWTPRDWTPRLQGWKIHVSATPEDAEATLAAVTELCTGSLTSFKFLPTLAGLTESSGKQAHRGGSGKFITIYPDDDDRLAWLLDELGRRLAGRQGPYILSDLRVGDAPVFVRYGGIVPLSIPGEDDHPVSSIVLADSRLVPDERQPRFHLPEGVELPAVLAEAYAHSQRETPSRLDEFTEISPLHFSNAGGVYRATLPDGAVRVLREARPHAGLDGRGRCAVTRQKVEQIVLEELAGLPGVQHLRQSFEAWEHRYLELDYVEGMTLSSWMVRHIHLQSADPAEYSRRATAIARQVVSIVDSIHARGWALGDIHAGNVLVGEDDEVTVVDLEDATRLDAEREVGFRVFEYCADPAVDAAAADWFAVARVLMLLFEADWEIEAVSPSYWTTALARVAEVYGSEAADVIADVEGRFPRGTRSVLACDVTLEAPSEPVPSVDAVAALLSGLDWSRRFAPDDAFPGDVADAHERSRDVLWSGRAGVLMALSRVGVDVGPADIDALETSARQWPHRLEPGLYHGLAGVALTLHDLDRGEAALEAAGRALLEAQGRRRLDLADGVAGVILVALEIARARDDEQLREEALAAYRRLHLTVTESDTARAALAVRRGLFGGLAGLALVDLAVHWTTGDAEPLERARERVVQEVDDCVPNGAELMVKDDANNRLMPYLEWGSAGVWTATLLVEDQTGTEVISDELRRGLAAACSADTYVYPGLAHGRAGILATLVSAGPGYAAEADRQAELLRRRLLVGEHGAFVIGDGLIRLSSDLCTGAAGVALALHAHHRRQPWLALPLATNTIEALVGGESDAPDLAPAVPTGSGTARQDEDHLVPERRAVRRRPVERVPDLVPLRRA